jgi:hypothetical protein
MPYLKSGRAMQEPPAHAEDHATRKKQTNEARIA